MHQAVCPKPGYNSIFHPWATPVISPPMMSNTYSGLACRSRITKGMRMRQKRQCIFRLWFGTPIWHHSLLWGNLRDTKGIYEDSTQLFHFWCRLTGSGSLNQRQSPDNSSVLSLRFGLCALPGEDPDTVGPNQVITWTLMKFRYIWISIIFQVVCYIETVVKSLDFSFCSETSGPS